MGKFEPRYLVALDEIYHGEWYARRRLRILRLERAVAFFWPDGHPTRLIHITGTGGKGSVAHYLEQGLGRHGTTGSWTGPHVFDYAERFSIDARSPSHDEIAEIYREILRPYLDRLILESGHGLGFPETGILLSLHLMARHRARWGIMEVGHGGRYSLLRALAAEACVLTNIGTDHLVHLGDEVWQRALEKAGLAQPGRPFFTAATGPALSYVTATAESEGAEVEVLEAAEIAEVRHHADRELAAYEAVNLALAIKVIRGLETVHEQPKDTVPELLAGMRGRLPGRFSEVEPGVVVDIAHNKEKIEALADNLRAAYPGREFRFLIALTRSRDPVEVFRPLCALARRIVVTTSFHAGQEPQEIRRKLEPLCSRITVVRDPRVAFEQERATLGEGEILVLTGSGYMIDQALNPDPYVGKTNASFGRRSLDPAR